MYELVNMEVVRQRRAELLREASRLRLERTLRADRKRYAARLTSTMGWELARVAGRVRKSFRVPNSSG